MVPLLVLTLLLIPASVYSLYDAPPTTEVYAAIAARAITTTFISNSNTNTNSGTVQQASATSSSISTNILFPSSSSSATLGIAAVSEISVGMSTQVTKPAAMTYTAGFPAKISGAPPLPSLCKS
jgi:hypothetical protein